MPTTRRPGTAKAIRWKALVALTAVGVLATACGSGGGNAAPTPTSHTATSSHVVGATTTTASGGEEAPAGTPPYYEVNTGTVPGHRHSPGQRAGPHPLHLRARRSAGAVDLLPRLCLRLAAAPAAHRGDGTGGRGPRRAVATRDDDPKRRRPAGHLQRLAALQLGRRHRARPSHRARHRQSGRLLVRTLAQGPGDQDEAIAHVDEENGLVPRSERWKHFGVRLPDSRRAGGVSSRFTRRARPERDRRTWRKRSSRRATA